MMFTEEEILIKKCPKCGNTIIINQVWIPGGCNDYGSFEVECLKCKQRFDMYIGRDVDESSIESGAILLSKKYKD